MYGTQCNDIISNIVFIRIFFTLFSKRMISFITLQCELFTSCNVSNNASLVERKGGDGQPNVERPGQGEGVPKIPIFVRTSFMDDPIYRYRTLMIKCRCQMIYTTLKVFALRVFLICIFPHLH